MCCSPLEGSSSYIEPTKKNFRCTVAYSRVTAHSYQPLVKPLATRLLRQSDRKMRLVCKNLLDFTYLPSRAFPSIHYDQPVSRLHPEWKPTNIYMLVIAWFFPSEWCNQNQFSMHPKNCETVILSRMLFKQNGTIIVDRRYHGTRTEQLQVSFWVWTGMLFHVCCDDTTCMFIQE